MRKDREMVRLSCLRKKAFLSEEDALTAGATALKRGNFTTGCCRVYRCPRCKKWHLTKKVD